MRMLHLTSPNLPVGAFAYSQGLEGAVDCHWVSDPESLGAWLRLQVQEGLAYVELPLLIRSHQACMNGNVTGLQYWNALLLACRETEELRLSEIATGTALARLLPTLSVPLPMLSPATFLCLYAHAAAHWQMSWQAAAAAYTWAWLENQVIAATRLFPLGQTQAQGLLVTLQDVAERAVAQAEAVTDDDIGTSLSGVALASLHHENQYSRLFRS